MIRIPLALPEITEADIDAVTRVLRTPWQSLGQQLEEFEASVARYTGVSHAVAVNSGTTALHLCLRALGIKEGDEVILPSFTFIAVANAVRYVRATPVFVDIETQSLNLDPSRVEEALSPKTKAIVLPHTFGRPAALDGVLALARSRSLHLVEDACEAIGAEYNGRKVGTMGIAGTFAFYPNKQITTGEGGMLVTDEAKIAKLARSLRNQGRSTSDEWLAHTELGYNYRISEINCALGKEQLKRIESVLQRRERIACLYHERLANNPALVLPSLSVPHCKISWFAYAVRLSPEFNRSHRDWIWSQLAAEGIGCGRYFGPIHLQPIYGHEPCKRMALPVTEASADRCLALPFFNNLCESQIDEVCEALTRLIRAALAANTHTSVSQTHRNDCAKELLHAD